MLTRTFIEAHNYSSSVAFHHTERGRGGIERGEGERIRERERKRERERERERERQREKKSERERQRERQRQRIQNSECFIVEGHLIHYKWYDYKHAHTTYTKQLTNNTKQTDRTKRSRKKKQTRTKIKENNNNRDRDREREKKKKKTKTTVFVPTRRIQERTTGPATLKAWAQNAVNSNG